MRNEYAGGMYFLIFVLILMTAIFSIIGYLDKKKNDEKILYSIKEKSENVCPVNYKIHCTNGNDFYEYLCTRKKIKPINNRIEWSK